MAALCDVTRNFNISPKVVTTFHYSCLLNITSVFPQRHKVSVLSGGCNQRTLVSGDVKKFLGNEQRPRLETY